LRKPGWKQRTESKDALAATVDWYGKFEGWFGDIEGVLTAHPVVQGDQVVQSAGVRLTTKTDEVQGRSEAHAGAVAPEADDVRKLDEILMAIGSHHANGKSGNGVAPAKKKRKADEMLLE